MEKLKDIEHPKGTGIPNLFVELIKRTDKKAIYLRSDGYYEVFKIRIRKPVEAFGKKYPEKELYPGNEDFGNIAICTSDRDIAESYYAKI